METKYTKEFKTEAIRLGEREGVAAASENLGNGIKTLYAWQRVQRRVALLLAAIQICFLSEHPQSN